MSTRWLLVVVCCGLFAGSTPAQTAAAAKPRHKNTFVLGISQTGINYQIKDDTGCVANSVPYPCLTLPHVVYLGCRFAALTYALATADEPMEEEDTDVTAPEQTRSSNMDDTALEHLFAIGQRCERAGDYDMACNCYTEIVRLRPHGSLAASAEIHRRRLEDLSSRTRTPVLEKNTQRTEK